MKVLHSNQSNSEIKSEKLVNYQYMTKMIKFKSISHTWQICPICLFIHSTSCGDNEVCSSCWN